jgi:hypothetical protein
VKGLRELIGGEKLKKELLSLLDKVDTAKERCMVMLLAIEEDDEKQVEMFLKAVLEKK